MAVKRWNSTTNQWEAFGSPQINPASIGAAPAIHATQHASTGFDPISPASIGAVNVVSGQVTVAPTNTGVVRNIFASTTTPSSSNGIDGDVWLRYS